MNKKYVDILSGLFVLAGCAYIYKLGGYSFILGIITISVIVKIWKAFNFNTN